MTLNVITFNKAKTNKLDQNQKMIPQNKTKVRQSFLLLLLHLPPQLHREDVSERLLKGNHRYKSSFKRKKGTFACLAVVPMHANRNSLNLCFILFQFRVLINFPFDFALSFQKKNCFFFVYSTTFFSHPSLYQPPEKW